MGKEFTAIAVGLVAATLYAGYRAVDPDADRAPGPAQPVRASRSGWRRWSLFGAAVLVVTWPREQGPAA